MFLMGPIRKHVTMQNTCNHSYGEDFSEHWGGGGESGTYITVGGPGCVIWLSVNLAIKSPDPNEHGGGHVLPGKKLQFLSCKDFKLNKEWPKGVICPVVELPCRTISCRGEQKFGTEKKKKLHHVMSGMEKPAAGCHGRLLSRVWIMKNPHKQTI